MPIIKRKCREDGFAIIGNELLQSEDLTYEAKGLLVELLSRPEDWRLVKSQLLRQHTGKDRLTRILGELQTAGFVKIEVARASDGKISDRYWVVASEPLFASEKPNDGKPCVGQSTTKANPPLQIKTATKKEDTKKDISISSSKPPKGPLTGFDSFWQAYPRKVGKGAARKAWAKVDISNGQLGMILAAVERQKTCEQWQEARYIPHPATWLNQQRWEDEPDPPSSVKKYDKEGYDEDGFDVNGVSRYGTRATPVSVLFARTQEAGSYPGWTLARWEKATAEFRRRKEALGLKLADKYGMTPDEIEVEVTAIDQEIRQAAPA